MSNHEELLDDLIYYSRAGELEELKELKALPENFVEKDDSSKTALHMASANNHIGKVLLYALSRAIQLISTIHNRDCQVYYRTAFDITSEKEN